MPPSDIAPAADGIRYSGFVVLPEYLDSNGHMNVGCYSVLFDKALDLPWERLGPGFSSIEATGRSSFAPETPVTCQRELRESDPLDFTFQLIDFDARRAHYFMTMLHARALAGRGLRIDLDLHRHDGSPQHHLARRQACAPASPARRA